MKVTTALTSAAVAAGAVLALPAPSAQADVSPKPVQPTPAAAGKAPVIKVQVTPGAHQMRIRIPVSPSAQTPPAVRPEARPEARKGKKSVKPRVNCGGFNGWIEWGGWGSIAIPAYIDVWGKVWSTCNSTTYLYLDYSHFTSPHHKKISQAGPHSTHGVNWDTDSHSATFGQIKITTCSTYRGWSCGKPEKV
ncbi:hypothetical protein [Actinomadura macrotermitis]|uniref:Secreted protein n=1 Tax=Actinomadura macrotermitis TaxID=2585200 RepID=A0A7K0BQW7_9ACTN|nr:hypothetical protein [Actinomadura macrotermitis]MQY03436.1 hypothetical protein [Actinomadura macrotermitis]